MPRNFTASKPSRQASEKTASFAIDRTHHAVRFTHHILRSEIGSEMKQSITSHSGKNICSVRFRVLTAPYLEKERAVGGHGVY